MDRIVIAFLGVGGWLLLALLVVVRLILAFIPSRRGRGGQRMFLFTTCLAGAAISYWLSSLGQLSGVKGLLVVVGWIFLVAAVIVPLVVPRRERATET